MRAKSKRHTSSHHHLKRRGTHLVLPIAFATLVLVGLATAGILIPHAIDAEPEVAAVVVYTPPDAMTSAAVIPNEMRDALTSIANDHNAIRLLRIGGDGTVTSETIDMTPRTSSGEVLKVPERITATINTRIAALADKLNEPSPGTQDRALYQGLLQARIPSNTPVWIVSSGIDTAPPVDARELAWEVPVEDVVAVVTAANAVPDMDGAEVKFIMTAPAGKQQIRTAQVEYLHTLWRELLTNGGAVSLDFIDTAPGEPGSDDQVPVVPLPTLPGTPVPPVPDPVDPASYSCTLNTSAGFVPDTDTLLDEDAVRASLADCVGRMTPGSKIHLDGWVAYFGKVGSDGKPTTAGDVGLSQRRCDRIKALLASMGVPEGAITTKGWGAVNQPDPQHPTSQANRVVRITVTPPQKGQGHD